MVTNKTNKAPPVKSAAALDSHKSVNPNPKVKVEYSEIATKQK